MSHFLIFYLGLLIGVILGLFVIALCRAASLGDSWRNGRKV